MTRPRRSRTTVPSTKGTALVTGGARRVGAAIATALAEDGWDIAVHYSTSKDDAASVVEAIRGLGRRAAAFDADLDDEDATVRLVARVAEALERPLCLVNNASIFEADDATSLDYATLATHTRVNVAAPIVLARTMHALLRAKDRGVVVNLLDQKLFNLNADFLSYTISKAALHTATELLARALAPKLRIVGLAPGITLPSADQTRRDFAQAHVRTPLGRSSTPADIAAAVCFIANAQAITGSTLIVDGGQHLVPSERDVMFLTRGSSR
jgi:NAD(P)-dependent dehydrogenase (short-subunit alcohol dehydrogenase family)